MALVEGGTLTSKVGTGEGKDGVVYTDYAAFAADVKVGERVLLDDGKLALRVRKRTGRTPWCAKSFTADCCVPARD